MAYQAGTATDIHDLMDKLTTFAQANGWTEDEYIDAATGQLTLHRDNCYVSFRWDDNPATDLGVYQSTGWAASNFPHEMPGDSGNGDATDPINAERRVNFVQPGPYTQYYFFAHTSPYYIHIVVEVDSGRYRHFGFGHLNKIGTWTGGEYCYGHVWDQGATAIDSPISGSHAMGLDTVCANNTLMPTVRVEGMPGQDGSSEWMVLGNTTSGGTDTAGNPRAYGLGGWRGGLWGYALGWIPMVRLNAYKPLIPIPVWYRDATPAPDAWVLLGHQPEVAIVNMKNYNPADVITIGGTDDWVVFPWVRKQNLGVDTEESWNAGIAYRKRT